MPDNPMQPDRTNKQGFDNEFIPPMTSVASGVLEEIAPGLSYLTDQIVNLCFVHSEDSPEKWVLIDAGMPHSAERIRRYAAEQFGQDTGPQAIILTHGHFDHVGSLAELADYWDVPVYAHKQEIPYLTGQSDYPPARADVGGMVARLSPAFPNHGINLGERIQPLPSDHSVPFLPEWQWIHTPGHTPGHISLFRTDDRALIAGDAFVTVRQESLYQVLFQLLEINGPPAYFTMDWDDARRSIKKLYDLQPAVAITGHGRSVSGDELINGLERLIKVH